MPSRTRYPVSDHCDGERFFNANGIAGSPFSKVPRMLLERRRPWPAHVEVPAARPPVLADGHEVAITFIGHATFLMQTRAGNVIVDPVFARHAGPFGMFGPVRVRAPGVAFADLPAINVVLLSHNHYDHCDLRALRALERRFSPHFVTPLGNARLLKGIGARRVEELDWWDAAQHALMAVTVTPAQHFSARTPFDRNRALWGGFMLAAGSKRIYVVGDTGYAAHFGDVRARLGAPDVAIMPIGAYEPRWFMRSIHVNPAEAVQAHLDVGAALSIASHYGTFRLTSEGIDEPVTALCDAMRERGVAREAFRVVDVGGSIMV